jgi:predicted TIM-barrel fold metal-dependent hydrolase
LPPPRSTRCRSISCAGDAWSRPDNWRRATRTPSSSSTIAAYPNIAIKISGACTLSHEKFPYQDIWDPLARIFDAFGFRRCLWGTDWTRAVKLLTYREGVEAFRVTDRLSDSDRAALMGDSLTRIYNWSPSKA